MQLTLIPTDLRNLTHNAKELSFFGDINDVVGQGFQRFYDDACDEGIALLNPKTGNITHWTVVYELRDANENELQGWVLHPTWNSVHRNPSLNGYTITLFND